MKRQGERNSPPCITARRGGCGIKKNDAQPPNLPQTGWFTSFLLDRKTTPTALRAASPPCGKARRGITPSHISSEQGVLFQSLRFSLELKQIAASCRSRVSNLDSSDGIYNAIVMGVVKQEPCAPAGDHI